MTHAPKRRIAIATEALQRIAACSPEDFEILPMIASDALTQMQNPSDPVIGLRGRKFGFLTVIEPASDAKNEKFWVVECSCGERELRKGKSIRANSVPWAACQFCEPGLQSYMANARPSVYANPNHVRGCTGKKKFGSEGAAIDAAATMTATHGPKAAYHCGNCEGWHLTSRLEPSRHGLIAERMDK